MRSHERSQRLDKPPVRIPEGEYQLKFWHYETIYAFGHPKIVMHFTVCDIGPYLGVPLARYYNVGRLKGKSGKGKSFVASGWHSDLVLEHIELFRMRIARLDRIPMCLYKGKLLLGSVRNVKHRGDQRDYPEQVQYSVIARLLGVVTP